MGVFVRDTTRHKFGSDMNKEHVRKKDLTWRADTEDPLGRESKRKKRQGRRWAVLRRKEKGNDGP